jgi:hypothetical protein
MTAYSMERQQGTGNGWALSLDDLDVCQLLPLRGDQFEQGVCFAYFVLKTPFLIQKQILVLPEGRQWSYTPDLLFKHPVDQTDSFILYVKSAILLSRVKTYNLRFRWRTYNLADGAAMSPQNTAFEPTYFEEATSSPEFIRLDQIVVNFLPSFPARLRSAVENDVLDPYLYTACTAGNLYEASTCLCHSDVLTRLLFFCIGRISYFMNLMQNLTGTIALQHRKRFLHHAPLSTLSIH